MSNVSFRIEGSLTSLNDYISAERTNKFMAAGIKKKETHKVWAYAENAKRQFKPNPNGLYDLFIRWYEKDNRKDSDNVFSSVKFILDGIVKAGIINGDGRKYIRNIHHYIDTDAQSPHIDVLMSLVI